MTKYLVIACLASAAAAPSLVACGSNESAGEEGNEAEAASEPTNRGPIERYEGDIWCRWVATSEDPWGLCYETRAECNEHAGEHALCRSLAEGWALSTRSAEGFEYTHLYGNEEACSRFRTADDIEHQPEMTECYRFTNESFDEAAQPATPPGDLLLRALGGWEDPMSIPTSESPPVEIVDSGVRERYGHKRLHARFRNLTDRTINGIRFGAFCYDNFNEPVQGRGRRDSNYQAAQLQDRVAPDATSSSGSYWNLFRHDACTKVIVVVHEVHFTNNETWEGVVVQENDPRATLEE